MPQVPTYQGPQVREAALEGGFQRTPNVGAPLEAVGKGLAVVGEAVDRYAFRQDQAAADKAEAEITTKWLQWDADARKRYRGENVGQYEVEAQKFWKDTEEQYGQSLNSRAQALASRGLGNKRAQAMASGMTYVNAESERHADESAAASKQGEVQFAITLGTPSALSAARIKLQETNAAIGARKGWTTEQVQAANTKDVSDMHVAYTLNLSKRDPTAAQAYFTANKGEIVYTAQQALSDRLEAVSAVAEGGNAAEMIWKSAMGGKGFNAPLDMAGMEDAARKQFPNDPTRQKAAIDGLRDRAAAFDRSQKEFNAANINGAYAVWDKSRKVNDVRASAAYQALPEAEQRKLLLAMGNEMWQDESRAATRASRAAAEAARDQARESAALTRLQRQEKMNLLQNGDQYLRLSNPEVLGKMSRAEVEASRPLFGMDATQTLLNKWDTLQKPGKMIEAKIDTQDFNMLADQFGFKPFDPTKTEAQRRELGTLQYRVEQVIDMAQRQKGKELTREEKVALMKGEMSRVVTVDGWFSNPQVPVIALTPDQVRNVMVPPAERAKIVEALREANKTSPNNPAYAPTEENVRRLFLENKSRAAGLIDAK